MNNDNISFQGINISRSVLTEDFIVTIFLEGYLDSINSSRIIEYFNNTLSTCKGTKKVVLDLMKLTYVSSTGIGAFTTLLMSCKKKSIDLELIHVSSKITDVITLLGFRSFFVIRE